MATWGKRERLIVDTYEDTVRRGKAVEPVDVVQASRSDRDPSRGAGLGGDDAYARRANSQEAALAQHGQRITAGPYQTPGPFTPSNGLHSVGSDHVGVFTRSVNFAGSVRQGQTFVSDPAPGAARASIDGNHSYDSIQVHTAGAGETFEMRQHRRWRGEGG